MSHTLTLLLPGGSFLAAPKDAQGGHVFVPEEYLTVVAEMHPHAYG